MSTLTLVIIIVFVVGYICIATESLLKINKAAIALLMCVFCWTLLMMAPGSFYPDVAADGLITYGSNVKEVTTRSPSLTPSASMSAGFMSSSASGSAVCRAGTRLVIEPVCQCSSKRPVQNTNGYSSSGTSAGGSHGRNTTEGL